MRLSDPIPWVIRDAYLRWPKASCRSIIVLLLQAPVDPDSGYVSIQWLPWFKHQSGGYGLADGTAPGYVSRHWRAGGVQATLPEPSQCLMPSACRS